VYQSMWKGKNPNRSWTPSDDEELRAFAREGLNLMTISIKIERTMRDVRKRAVTLQIVMRQDLPAKKG
jgi:hypothetical protein